MTLPPAVVLDAARPPDSLPSPARARLPSRGPWRVVRPILQALFVVWAAFTLSFIVLYALPGDAVSRQFGTGDFLAPEQLEALRAKYGLDQPIIVQYFTQLSNVVRGDFGNSITTGKPVLETIATALPDTLALTGAALLVSTVLGGIIALATSYVRTPVLKQFLLSAPAVGVAIPGFWIGLVLLWLFSFSIPLFPAMGSRGIESLVLPTIALAIPTSATIAQVLTRSLLEEWQQPYAHNAVAKGLLRPYVLFRHVLRNALIPVLTVFALTAGGLLGGAIIAETIFSRNGIGRLTQLAVTDQDVPLVQGVVILSAVIYAVLNLLVDLIYPLLDPRIAGASKRRRATASSQAKGATR